MSAVCPNCGNQNYNPYSSACPACGQSASVSPDGSSSNTSPAAKSSIVGWFGFGLGVVANLIVIIGTVIALPGAIAAAGAGQELDKATAIMFGVGMLIVGGLALLGLVLSILGVVQSNKKAVSIIGIITCILPPVTYILTCVAMGIFMGATGQIQ